MGVGIVIGMSGLFACWTPSTVVTVAVGEITVSVAVEKVAASPGGR